MKETGDIRIDEMMPRLCEAWPVMTFQECLVPASASYRKLKSGDIKASGRIPVIDQGEAFISGYTDDPVDEYPGALPVIIFGDHTRRFKFVDFKFAVGAQGTHLLYPRAELTPKFFYHYLSTLNLESQGYSRHYKFLKQALIPIPPLREQQRIVVKLETLLGKVDACQQRLTRIPRLLKRFRQSVLAAACSGRLTADWRAEKIIDGTDEKPSVQSVVQNLARGDAEDLPELPEDWRWVQFGSVIAELRNGVSLRPNISPPGVPILRISSTRPGRVELADVRYMPNGDEFVCLYRLRDGDLLFTRYNGSVELLGICGMVRGLGDRTLLYPDKLMRVRFDRDWILPNYVEVFFSAPEVHARVVAKSKSSAGQNGVSGSDIKAQPFALPPLGEQREIVRRVDQLFTLADELEARYEKAQAHVDKLTQSLLAKAFRGELVPQDPNDKPASALLARIRPEANGAKKLPRRKAKVVASRSVSSVASQMHP